MAGNGGIPVGIAAGPMTHSERLGELPEKLVGQASLPVDDARAPLARATTMPSFEGPRSVMKRQLRTLSRGEQGPNRAALEPPLQELRCASAGQWGFREIIS
jgi:hypothetical protein